YVYIYLSNENTTPVEVFFDDFKVTHTPTDIVQKDDYYPFGLTFNSLLRENSLGNKYLFNGKERQELTGWDDYGARMYMADIGRWGVVDPMADQRSWMTPYNYVQNNPLNRIDPDGMLDEWRLNTETGDLAWMSDLGGDSQQTVHIGNRKTIIEGSKEDIHVGAVSKPGGSDGDFVYTASKADLWSDIPDEYQGHYSSRDLVERYNAAQDGGIKIRSIRDMEGQGLSRREMVWNRSDYGRHLVTKYGSKDAFYMAADLGMMPLPSPAGFDDFAFAGSGLSAINNFSKNRSALKVTSQLNIAARGVKLSNNPWIKFLQQNKGSWSGKDWLNQARQAYKVLKK
ncbi:RHS repeat-associated core domain-containing protein, partial [Algoriphagus sp. C2-6-M1]|uniref:RHS repeat-associated core domain-containing protein n=1 Tax=Algoriphagus persicinus TaxID=3108754 RepID=UPI002B38D6A6